ncbi:hypothetical protein B0H15DRAFT_461899 [Mycena belliarum]|uniref:Transmembrane protein n=1 Tax=Mycena belliarum TaxID=1033014 RepID=A0AAD6ULJ3_9AGAR|nr:hypothetical protein B0H15DRAFT_461899 [Mycena belliae]
MSTSYTIIDDRDKRVSYTGSWVVGGTSRERGGTVSSSLKVGDRFVVPFTGSGIGVYGTFDASSAGVKTSYAIDNGKPVIITSSSSGGDSYQQLFWRSPALPNTAHQLVVTMVAVNSGLADREGTIWFDYFNVSSTTATTATVATTATIARTSSFSSTVRGTSSGRGGATATLPTAAGHSPASSGSGVAVVDTGKKSTSHAAIIAVVVVLVLALLCAAAFLLRRRRKQQQQHKYTDFMPSAKMSTPMGGTPAGRPFLANSASMTSLSSPMLGSPFVSPAPGTYSTGPDGSNPHAPPAGALYRTADTPPPQDPAAYDPFSAAAGYAASSSSAPSSARPPLSVVGSAAPSTEYSDSIADLKRRQQEIVNSYEKGIGGYTPPMQHVDSGVRSLDPTGPTELPPVYTPN